METVGVEKISSIVFEKRICWCLYFIRLVLRIWQLSIRKMFSVTIKYKFLIQPRDCNFEKSLCCNGFSCHNQYKINLLAPELFF